VKSEKKQIANSTENGRIKTKQQAVLRMVE